MTRASARQAAGVSVALPRFIPLVQQDVATPDEFRTGSSVSQSPLSGADTVTHVPVVAPEMLSSPISLVQRLHLQRQAASVDLPAD